MSLPWFLACFCLSAYAVFAKSTSSPSMALLSNNTCENVTGRILSIECRYLSRDFCDCHKDDSVCSKMGEIFKSCNLTEYDQTNCEKSPIFYPNTLTQRTNRSYRDSNEEFQCLLDKIRANKEVLNSCKKYSKEKDDRRKAWLKEREIYWNNTSPAIVFINGTKHFQTFKCNAKTLMNEPHLVKVSTPETVEKKRPPNATEPYQQRFTMVEYELLSCALVRQECSCWTKEEFEKQSKHKTQICDNHRKSCPCLFPETLPVALTSTPHVKP